MVKKIGNIKHGVFVTVDVRYTFVAWWVHSDFQNGACVTLFLCVQPGESSLWKVIEESFQKPSLVADRLLTFIGCCLGANHLTHLHPYLFHFSQPCLPTDYSWTRERMSPQLFHTFPMAFGQIYSHPSTGWQELGRVLAWPEKKEKPNQSKSNLNTERPRLEK